MNEAGHNDRKLPFTAPKLEVYGRARDITRAVGNKGGTDGAAAGASNNKTSA